MKTKSFDCVEMKRCAQEKLMMELESMLQQEKQQYFPTLLEKAKNEQARLLEARERTKAA